MSSSPRSTPLALDLFGASALGDRLVDLVQSPPGFTLAAFVIAFLAGAAHAVGPGHGKSLAAATSSAPTGRCATPPGSG